MNVTLFPIASSILHLNLLMETNLLFGHPFSLSLSPILLCARFPFTCFSFNYFQFILRIVAFDINLDKWRLLLILWKEESFSFSTKSSAFSFSNFRDDSEAFSCWKIIIIRLSTRFFQDQDEHTIKSELSRVELVEESKGGIKSINIFESIIYDMSQKFFHPRRRLRLSRIIKKGKH